MPIYAFRTSTYARNIYLYGTNSFQTIAAAYVEPVKQYGVVNFTAAQIDKALTEGWISQQEFDDTMVYAFPQ